MTPYNWEEVIKEWDTLMRCIDNQTYLPPILVVLENASPPVKTAAILGVAVHHGAVPAETRIELRLSKIQGEIQDSLIVTRERPFRIKYGVDVERKAVFLRELNV